MSGEKKYALLRAISENPDEDTPRLAFADLLDETDDDHDRAEFIRLQCRLYGADWTTPEFESAWDRQDELFRQHQPCWETETFGQRGVKRIEFSRGFVEGCSTTAAAVITRGAEWCQRMPLRQLNMYALSGRTERLAACSHLRYVKQLEIRDGQFKDADLTALAESCHLARLEELSLGQLWVGHPTRVTDWGVCDLAEAEFLPRLKYLSITANWNLSWYGLVTLAQSKRITSLNSLQLMNTTIDHRGVYALAEAGCNDLAQLMIIGSQIGDAGLIALVTSGQLPSLSQIHLQRSRVTSDVFRALAHSQHWSRVRFLDLCQTPLKQVTAEEIGTLLVARPDLKLNLSRCGLSREVRAKLDRRFPGRVQTDTFG